MKKSVLLSILFLAAALYFLSYQSSTESQQFNFEGVKRLPVQHEGRQKPLDTVARNALLVIHGKQSLRYENRKVAPIEWFLDMMINPEKAVRYLVFQIDHPDVLGLIQRTNEDGRYYSFQDLTPYPIPSMLTPNQE